MTNLVTQLLIVDRETSSVHSLHGDEVGRSTKLRHYESDLDRMKAEMNERPGEKYRKSEDLP